MYDVTVLRVKYLLIINYCYLVIDSSTKSAILVDPAWESKKIEKTLAETSANLVGVLITHHHFDHINLANFFAKKYDVPVFLSQIEIDFYSVKCTNLHPIVTFVPFTLKQLSITPFLTPGHTKGGTSYLLGNNFFCGDTLFIEGCGICTGKGGDPAALFDTLQHIKTDLAPNTLIYPGHSYGDPVGQPFSYVCEKNVYLMIKNKNKFIDFRMRPKQSHLFKFK